jgi:hypothetical protein
MININDPWAWQGSDIARHGDSGTFETCFCQRASSTSRRYVAQYTAERYGPSRRQHPHRQIKMLFLILRAGLWRVGRPEGEVDLDLPPSHPNAHPSRRIAPHRGIPCCPWSCWPLCGVVAAPLICWRGACAERTALWVKRSLLS